MLIGLFVWINNISYKVISVLVVRQGSGIHPKHRIMNYHQFFLDNLAETDTVLDIGCGNGALAYDISKKSRSITAIDIEKKNIRTARKRFGSDNLRYIVGDATTYDFKESFDVIVLSNVLEHIEHRIEFLLKIKHLAPKILIRVPMITRDWLAMYKKENGYEYRLDPTHYIEYTEDEFRDEALRAGLKIQNLKSRFGELYSVLG